MTIVVAPVVTLSGCQACCLVPIRHGPAGRSPWLQWHLVGGLPYLRPVLRAAGGETPPADSPPEYCSAAGRSRRAGMAAVVPWRSPTPIDAGGSSSWIRAGG